jgi:prophage tail gpP-like protein
MTDATRSSNDQYAHLRASAAAQRQATVDRLKQAIEQLQADQRPVNTFTIKEVSGLDYMAYYRNREAFRLFQEHSTHLRQEREKKQANQRRPRQKRSKPDESLHRVKVSPRDPLLDCKRPRLVELLHEAEASRDEARQQAQTERTRIEQQAQTHCAELEQRYHKLLQEHMHCGVTIAKLEAQVAEYLAFMERFRTALRQEEHGTQQ